MRDRPDILLILSDQHAAKVAGCYGDPLGVTPNLDALAARGVIFDSAYCPSPICTPSRMSMLTGRWPHEQSCWTLEDALASDLPTWAHSLGATGWRSILCGRLHSIGPDQLHGFMERDEGDCSPNWLGAPRQDLGPLAGAQGPMAVDPMALAEGPAETSRSIRLSGRGQSGYEVVDDRVTEAARARIAALAREREAGDDRPFLLSVGFLLPHCPFVARPADFDRFAGRVGMPAIPRADPATEHPWITAWRRLTATDAADPPDVLRARTAYWGLVHAMDAKIGRVLAALSAAGLAQNTLVIYASDHGEQAGERDLWWKNTFFEEAVRVPLVMAWPGRLPAGTRCGRVVNLVDLGATMIAAAGAPALPRSRGRSLLGIAADPAAPWDDETFSEYVTDLSSAWTGPEATRQRMIRQGRWKLVWIDGYRPQLFDLADDPGERRDLGADPAFAEVRERLSARVLKGWRPERIAAEVALRTGEKRILRAWGAATRPASAHVSPIRAGDSWLERNG